MTDISLANYTRSNLEFMQAHQGYRHNYTQELELVICSNASLAHLSKIIGEHYPLIATISLNWQPECVLQHCQRLQISDINSQIHHDLYALVYAVEKPSYLRNENGDFQLQLVDPVSEALSAQSLHFTRSIEQFFYVSALILGEEKLGQLVTSAKAQQHLQFSVGDLIGSNGWQDFKQMFAIANLCADWVVMRNAEFLPDNFWGNDKDIDILCRRLTDFVCALNAQPKNDGNANFQVTVAETIVDVDARVVGDDYYDKAWQLQMLADKNIENSVPQLSEHDYFYSLLYHARIHKPNVKPVYVERLQKLADKLSIDFSPEILTSDELSAQLLDSFLRPHQFSVTYPNDYACYENINRSVISYSQCVSNKKVSWQFIARRLAHDIFIWACKLSPRGLKETIKRIIK